jgi:hypothetical protein
LCNLERIISGTVVDDEHAKAGDRLGKNAVDAVRQEPAVLVAGNNEINAAHENNLA